MSEPLKVIASAFSVTAILMFMMWSSYADFVKPEDADAWAAVWIMLALAATTGCGWLWYRSQSKGVFK